MTVGPRGQGLKRQLMMVFVTLVAVTVSLTTARSGATRSSCSPRTDTMMSLILRA